ncbi:tripartite tricarboxylate transporter TctB family protein [Oceanobacillus oncorhynchi]|uniref:tripartite tricarboxylate transporter TctB family protein n=1 Tax=Oceanobacillus TaxID=182709 RepID=UPI0021172B49|nr:tripartite tricarboxylate transporter TctB family protein [Oceanobacillus oncorhynchi]UUI39454.1 tripartite tricarboxylate transporter TctB family protein [Oceanobacillus oncorhynchi]
MERNYGDLITGIILLAISIVMFIGSLNMEALTEGAVGSDFMPKVIAILIAVMSIPVIVSGFKSGEIDKTDEEAPAAEVKEGTDNKNSFIYLILTIILLFVYLFLIPILGFLITTAAYLIIQMLLFSKWTIKNALLYGVISIVTSSVIYFVFRNVFYVMLPAGIFG